MEMTDELRQLLVDMHIKMCIGHRELWLWLADNPLSDKRDWPGWAAWAVETVPETGVMKIDICLRDLFLDPESESYCFGCMWTTLMSEVRYAVDRSMPANICGNCLLTWPGGNHCMYLSSSPPLDDELRRFEIFGLWRYGKLTPDERSRVARQIANLPVALIPESLR
jgi:hypothetical protein